MCSWSQLKLFKLRGWCWLIEGKRGHRLRMLCVASPQQAFNPSHSHVLHQTHCSQCSSSLLRFCLRQLLTCSPVLLVHVCVPTKWMWCCVDSNQGEIGVRGVLDRFLIIQICKLTLMTYVVFVCYFLLICTFILTTYLLYFGLLCNMVRKVVILRSYVIRYLKWQNYLNFFFFL